MTPTPTTDSAVSPVSDERLKQLQFEVSAIEPSRRISMSSEDRRDLLSIFAELALSRRSLDTADGVEAVAWAYELATRISHASGEPPTYHGFDKRLSFEKPDVPEGSIRNLCALASRTPNTEMPKPANFAGWKDQLELLSNLLTFPADLDTAQATIEEMLEGWQDVMDTEPALASPPSPAEEAVTDDGFTAHDFASLEALLRTGTETGIKAALSNNFNVILAALDRAASPPVGTDAARDVLAERRRQVETEGWTPEHDDAHGNGELSAAAGVYALAAASHDYRWVLRGSPVNDYLAAVFKLWPFEWSWFKPKSRRQDKVKAAALLLADIEREDRAALTASLQLNKKG